MLPGRSQRDQPGTTSFRSSLWTSTTWTGGVAVLLPGFALGEAVDQLNDALAGVDPEYTRARGGLHLDLAQALIAADAPDAAQHHLRLASQLASQTGSVRQRRRIAQLAA